MKSISSLDEYFMTTALKQALKAAQSGDVPVGVVIVKDDKIIAKGYNQVEKLNDSTAHAEIIAIKKAFKKLHYKHLEGCSIYVTLEPCSMCAGALVLARIERLILGAYDPKAGACGSLYNIIDDNRLNHRLKITNGILADECSRIISQFFMDLRNKNKQAQE